MLSTQQSVIFEPYEKVPVTDFVAELSFEFPDMPEEALAHYVLKAIDRLAVVGKVLRRTAIVNTQDCVDNYLLEPPDCMAVSAIVSMYRVAGNCCGTTSRLNYNPGSFSCCFPCGTISWFEAPNTIYIQPGKCGDSYRINMAVKPTKNTCEVDRVLYDSYEDLILTGTKYYLYMMPSQGWSSVNRAQELKQDFEIGIRAAGIDVMAGGQRGALKMRRLKPM